MKKLASFITPEETPRRPPTRIVTHLNEYRMVRLFSAFLEVWVSISQKAR